MAPKLAAAPVASPCRLLGRRFCGAPAQQQAASAGVKRAAAARTPRATRGLVTRVAAGTPAGGAATGDYVEIHYTGTLDDGSVFDTSRERGEPLPFIIGEGRVVPGFESMVMGLTVGQSKKERMEADLAYGDWREEMTASVPLANGG